jgi:hypothetical protein
LYRLVLKPIICDGDVYPYLVRLEAELCAYFFRDSNFYEGRVRENFLWVSKVCTFPYGHRVVDACSVRITSKTSSNLKRQKQNLNLLSK